MKSRRPSSITKTAALVVGGVILGPSILMFGLGALLVGYIALKDGTSSLP
jgi:hypothetical protein